MSKELLFLSKRDANAHKYLVEANTSVSIVGAGCPSFSSYTVSYPYSSREFSRIEPISLEKARTYVQKLVATQKIHARMDKPALTTHVYISDFFPLLYWCVDQFSYESAAVNWLISLGQQPVVARALWANLSRKLASTDEVIRKAIDDSHERILNESAKSKLVGIQAHSHVALLDQTHQRQRTESDNMSMLGNIMHEHVQEIHVSLDPIMTIWLWIYAADFAKLPKQLNQGGPMVFLSLPKQNVDAEVGHHNLKIQAGLMRDAVEIPVVIGLG